MPEAFARGTVGRISLWSGKIFLSIQRAREKREASYYLHSCRSRQYGRRKRPRELRGSSQGEGRYACWSQRQGFPDVPVQRNLAPGLRGFLEGRIEAKRSRPEEMCRLMRDVGLADGRSLTPAPSQQGAIEPSGGKARG